MSTNIQPIGAPTLPNPPPGWPSDISRVLRVFLDLICRQFITARGEIDSIEGRVTESEGEITALVARVAKLEKGK